MRKLTVLTLVCISASHFAMSQTPAPSPSIPVTPAIVKGKVADTTENKVLPNSPVLLLRKSDSILVRYTRTEKNGQFTLTKVPPGKYLLLVTCPRYADYVDELEVKDSNTVVLPPVGLVLKAKLLEQVVVTGNKGAIQIKGDTVEFRADSFKTQAGATVEDLLKKLPGIQVDRNGKITAQGQTVQKVLVDGEEFFGDDPTLVTQNLRADMVDKVQVFDKKSDQAAFTNIDDGQKTKTINLKLKDDKKRGFFGKVQGSVGTDGYYDEQAMINMFRKKQKVAAYGIFSNTGKVGLNWNERDKFGQSMAGMADFDDATGFFMINGGGGDEELDSWSGRFEGQGLPTVKTAGVHYNDKWNDDKQTVNGNYKFMQLNVKDSANSRTQYILPDSLYATNPLYYNNSQTISRKNIIRHSLDGSYELKFDSTSSIKIMADGGTDHKETSSLVNSQSLARDSSYINKNDRTVSTTGDKKEFNSNILWRKKLAKKGRTFSLNLRENYKENTSSGFLNSLTQFYTGGVFDRDSVVDQYKDYRTVNTVIDGRIVYTEPISKYGSLIASYGATMNYDHSNRNSYNKEAGGKYTQLDSTYSNDYEFDVFTHKGMLSYNYVKKKIRMNFGSGIGFTNFNQKDLHADTSIKRDFVNWYPSANFNYSFSQQARLGFFYNGSTNQPSIQQLQPIKQNEDPLNIVVGNPALKQSFQNNFQLWYFSYKVLTDRSININANYNFTNNAFASAVNLDPTGKRTTQTINVNGNYNANAWISYDFKWKKIATSVSFFSNINQSRNISVVNNLNNETNSGNYEIGFGLWKSKEKAFEVSMRNSATFTRSRSTLNPEIKTQYWTYSINPGFDVYLPAKFQIHGDANINLREKTALFQYNNNTVLLNGWIGKKFLKNDVLQIRASGNDLLNQNIGFNRSVNSNFISQNTNLTIRRYFLFQVIWNFTSAGNSTAAKK